MQVSDFSYDLPEKLIAQTPPLERGTSRLLALDRASGALHDSAYASVGDHLRSGDLLILNDTRVIKARLRTTKANGAVRELILVEWHALDNWSTHRVLHRGRLAVGEQLYIGDAVITVLEVLGNGQVLVRSDHDLLELADRYGQVPLPPYMRRDATALDIERYQTVWAKDKGSVAAPTASLNMTDDILRGLHARGVQIAYLTLHVGLGTFLPIRSDTLEGHHMHAEYFVIPAATVQAVQQAKAAGGRVVALGTTVARTLEYAHAGLRRTAADISGEADIFIYPGYNFMTIDGLLTNFHAPKSTVLMLTAAFAGWDHLRAAYTHAVAERYHFLSYGDSMLIV